MMYDTDAEAATLASVNAVHIFATTSYWLLHCSLISPTEIWQIGIVVNNTKSLWLIVVSDVKLFFVFDTFIYMYLQMTTYHFM